VWNLYFLLKFLLLGLGLLNFQALPNLVFAAFLVVPLPGAPWRIVRQLIAIPVGIALLYHDTWLPPFDRLLAQPGVLDFSPAYLVELAGRFVDWTVLGLCALLVIGYSYMANWIRLSTICLGGLIWLNLGSIPLLASPPRADAAPVVASAQGNDAPALQDNVALDTWLENFFRTEATRQTPFPLRSEQTAAFDVLFINVCSLAWDDLDAVELRDNALLKRMDVIFDRFNSATSYSGPAAIRLLRGSCGQPRHQALYEPAPEQCLLFQNLANLGFHAETLMNHNGKFDGSPVKSKPRACPSRCWRARSSRVRWQASTARRSPGISTCSTAGGSVDRHCRSHRSVFSTTASACMTGTASSERMAMPNRRHIGLAHSACWMTSTVSSTSWSAAVDRSPCCWYPSTERRCMVTACRSPACARFPGHRSPRCPSA